MIVTDLEPKLKRLMCIVLKNPDKKPKRTVKKIFNWRLKFIVTHTAVVHDLKLDQHLFTILDTDPN